MKFWGIYKNGETTHRDVVKAEAPKTRAEALEIINRWNALVAKEAIQAGLSNAKVFYFLGEDQWQ